MRISTILGKMSRVGLGLIQRKRFSKCGGRFRAGGWISIYDPYNGTVEIGDNCILHDGCRLFLGMQGSTLRIGNGTSLGPRTVISCATGIVIGDNCALSWDVTILDNDGHSLNGKRAVAPVKIGNNVWVGCKATILKGVTIGDGAIIGANTVVTTDVPDRVLVVGVPGKIIKTDVTWEL